ncbi:MAG: YcaO-like family protein [Deltaproteobacteria bacterium]|nr:YcaO-like family protein [Deltaproteobacteria bacterium]
MNSKIILNDAFKSFTLDQDKILPPKETVSRFREKLAGTGLNILDSTERIDNGRLGIPVYFSNCGKDAIRLTGTKKQMGKGATPQQAEASAVMELAERFSLFSFADDQKNFIIGKYADLKNEALSFEMIAKSVHDDSRDLEQAKKIFEELPLKWTKAYNLTRSKEILVPFDWFFAINEFNGPSAGNCTEEAVLQGLCEVVERHVSSIISRGNLNVPAIDADTATDPMVVEMLKKYKTAGIKLYLSDFSLDLGISSVGVMAFDPASFPETSEIVWTAGTTPDPQKALSRALTETAQLGGDFNTSSNYVASGLPKFTAIEQAKFITKPSEIVAISSLTDLSNNNIKIEIENCISALSKKGMEAILINIMHPVLEIPAFYSIIPGAHFRERTRSTSVGMFSTKLIMENFPPPEALARLMEADRILPEKYYIKFYIGACLTNTGAPEKALTCFHQALDLEPNEQELPTIYSYMGVCLKDLGRFKDALAILKKGERLDQERTDIYNLMGFCYFSLKKHEKAIECFKKNIRLDPGSAIDYANIASNYRDMGEKNKSIQYYTTALSIDPTIEFARENLKRLNG